jgi:hypothetical protein
MSKNDGLTPAGARLANIHRLYPEETLAWLGFRTNLSSTGNVQFYALYCKSSGVSS